MTLIAILVIAGVVMLLSAAGTRRRSAGSGALRILLGPALIVLAIVTLPFVLLSRVLLVAGAAVAGMTALASALARRR